MDQNNDDPQGILREMQRKSEDQLRVRNLMDDDYNVRWDSDKIFTVPGKDKDLGEGKGEAVLPRYIATKFMQEMAVLFINDDNVKHMKKYEKEYKGNPNVHWPDIEKRHALKTNDPVLLKKYYSQMFIRVEKEFGMGMTPTAPEFKPRDTRPISDQIMADLEISETEEKEVKSTDKEEFAKSIT